MVKAGVGGPEYVYCSLWWSQFWLLLFLLVSLDHPNRFVVCLFVWVLSRGWVTRLYSLISSPQVEKEAEAKGVPVAQALDIAIPPPRPKRKPNNPYPRKTGTGTLPISKTCLIDGKQSLGSEKVSLPEVKKLHGQSTWHSFVVCHVIDTDWCALFFF